MRYKTRKKVLKILGMLDTLHSKINVLIQNKMIDTLIETLTSCQESAIFVGNELEKYEHMTRVVELLELYCETVYQIGESVLNGKNYRQQYNILKRTLEEITFVLSDGENDYYEVAFLPYKASMWDSLESLWLIFSRDEKVKCHVIPIPYYEKKSDGDYSELQNERGLFSKFVPTENYMNIDLTQLEPDVIFIHNPYDDANYVTTVHPDYYSERLRALTDCLVYIPYFVTSDRITKELCLLPGVLYSHYTIVQSDKIKEQYIKYLSEAIEWEKMGEEWNFERKILGLGSPKLDKLLNSKKTEIEMLPEWSDKLINQKRVLLYNTGLSGILKYREKELLQMKYVFEKVQNEENIVLWWRPHPLMHSTIERLCPELMQEYEELVTYYIKYQIGIYDETADLNRAMVYADAYYGDWSSLIWLFMMTQKPILLYEPIFKIEDRVNITLKDFTYHKNRLWFSPLMFNGLFSYDIQTKKMEYLGKIPGERNYQEGISSVIIGEKEHLYLFPTKGKYFIIYDIIRCKFETIYLGIKDKIKQNSLELNEENCFIDGYKDKEYVYLMHYKKRELIKYNLNTKSIENSIIIKDNTNHENRGRRCCKNNEIIYFTRGNDCIYEYNTLSNEIGYTQLDNKNIFFMHEIEEGFVAISDKCINILNEKKELVKEIYYPKDFIGGEVPFSDFIKINNYIYMFPKNGNMILKLSVKEEKVECFLTVEETGQEYTNEYAYYYTCAHIVKNKIYAYALQKQCLHVIDLTDKSLEVIELIMDDRIENIYSNAKMFEVEGGNIEVEPSRAFYEKERKFLTIDKFIKAVANENLVEAKGTINDSIFANSEGNCSLDIYNFIKLQITK